MEELGLKMVSIWDVSTAGGRLVSYTIALAPKLTLWHSMLKLLPAVLVCHMGDGSYPAAPLLIHLPADAPGKDAAEGPSACALATHVRVERNSGALASAWTRPWLLKSFGN